MARRPGFVVNASREADGGTPPNNYIAAITVEIRAFWPPNADWHQVLDTIDDALRKARAEFDRIYTDTGGPHGT